MAKPHSKFVCRVREVRTAAGVSQQALASQVGLSRQALSALEAGRAIPRTDVALKLARALSCKVEALFGGGSEPRNVEARLATGSAVGVDHRVVLSEIGGELVARTLDGRGPESLQVADGIVTHTAAERVRVELIGEPKFVRSRLVIMGCAPALGLLSSRLAASSRAMPMAWVHGNSGNALDALERGDVHLAGIHLRDARSGKFNLPQVQRRFAGRKMLLVNFAAWEQGLVVAKGNPLRINSVEDLLRPRIRIVRREPGAGANKLLDQMLGEARVPALRPPALIARGHLEVAQAVAQGIADVGVAIGSVALAWGLDFIPLSGERFDLVFPEVMAGDERVEHLIDELGSRTFRRELGCLGGYETRESGHVFRAGAGQARR